MNTSIDKMVAAYVISSILRSCAVSLNYNDSLPVYFLTIFFKPLFQFILNKGTSSLFSPTQYDTVVLSDPLSSI